MSFLLFYMFIKSLWCLFFSWSVPATTLEAVIRTEAPGLTLGNGIARLSTSAFLIHFVTFITTASGTSQSFCVFGSFNCFKCLSVKRSSCFYSVLFFMSQFIEKEYTHIQIQAHCDTLDFFYLYFHVSCSSHTYFLLCGIHLCLCRQGNLHHLGKVNWVCAVLIMCCFEDVNFCILTIFVLCLVFDILGNDKTLVWWGRI